jgi:hypothetical protein
MTSRSQAIALRCDTVQMYSRAAHENHVTNNTRYETLAIICTLMVRSRVKWRSVTFAPITAAERESAMPFS